jgi:hypothetical protein
MANGNGFRAIPNTVPLDLTAPYTGRPLPDVTGLGSTSTERLPQTVQIYLPEVFPIPGAQEFNPTVSKATVAAETADIGLVVQLPERNIGIIRSVVLDITDMLTTTVVSWTLQINGAPVGGYNNLSIFPRVAPFVGNSLDTFIRVPQGAKITATYTNTDGGSYVVGISISGWFWPQDAGTQWLTRGPVL